MKNFWCEVNLDILADNINIIRKNSDKKLIAVVKSDAYGLGTGPITEFLDDKVEAFAVNDIEEALLVRSEKPVLILLPILTKEELEKAKGNFIFTVDSEESLDLLKDFSCKVHILVNTGMNRFGVSLDKVDDLINRINSDYPSIEIDGIYTHLHNTKNKKYTRRQILSFQNAVAPHQSNIKNIHILNSRGFLNYNNIIFDNCLRIGNLLYGYGGQDMGFRKIFAHKARLIYTTEIGKNGFVGYSRSHVRKNTRIGILEIGTAHGFKCRPIRRRSLLYNTALAAYRYLKNDSFIYYKGKMLKLLGNICMSYTAVSLDGLEDLIKVDGIVFDIKMSSVIADSSIEKRYIQGGEAV